MRLSLSVCPALVSPWCTQIPCSHRGMSLWNPMVQCEQDVCGEIFVTSWRTDKVWMAWVEYFKKPREMGNSGSSSSSRYDYQPSSRSSRRDEPRLPRYEDSPPSYHNSNYEQQVAPRYEQQYSRPSQAPASTAAPPPPVSKPHKKNLQRRFSRKYSVIADNYNDVEEVQQALRQAGLESSNLIVGIDFTKSNEWTGKKSFNGRSLHAIGAEMNPYEKAISIVGQTLSPFDDDNLIPCFGFGDSSTHDKQVFSFFPDHRPCEGFEEALRRYKAIVPHLRLAGPTSFAPIIEAAVDIVEQNGGQYHVLIIIAGMLPTFLQFLIYGSLVGLPHIV